MNTVETKTIQRPNVVTIPKSLTGSHELVVVPRLLFEKLLVSASKEQKILVLSKEARQLKKNNKLPILNSLADLR